MIAVTILMLVATGIVFSLGNSLRSAAGSDATIQAQLLAEEGVELVRAIKDSNTLQEKSIFENITRTVGAESQNMCASVCYIDDTDTSGIPILRSTTTSTSPLTGGVWFSQKKNSVPVIRNFTRTITAVEQGSDIKVTASVTYIERGVNRTINYSTLLTKWYVNQP